MTIPPGTTWRNSRTGSAITVVEHTPEQVVFERMMPPGKGKADAHFHNDFVQSWEVVRGELTCDVDGDQRTMQVGERVDVPRGTDHRDPYNTSDSELVFRFLIEPDAAPFIEVFARTLGDLLERDALNEQDEFGQLQLFGVLHAGKADSWKAGLPVPVQRPVIAAGAAIGRLMGRRPVMPS